MSLTPSESPAEVRPLIQSTTIGHVNTRGLVRARRAKPPKECGLSGKDGAESRRMRGYRRRNMVWIVDITNGRKLVQDHAYLVSSWRSISDDP
jgi:hypothetical protein